MTAPNPADRLTMAKALADAFWRTAERPMRWDSNSTQQRQVWLEMADAAFAAGREIKAARLATPNSGRDYGATVKEIAA